MSPDNPVEDAPLQIADWQPQNYSDQYLGMTDLRTAFAQSLNTAAVRLQEQVGRDKVIAVAREMGIESPLPPHPSLALGSAEATLLELTAAYAAVLADVRRVEPYALRAARAPGGATFRRRPTASPRPDWPRPAIMELLFEAVRAGTGSAAGLDVPVFGKTGTTQDHRDAWFIGFTEDLVVGVWVGNDDHAPMNGVTGGGMPAQIWRSFAADALKPAGEVDVAAAGRVAPHAAPLGGVVIGAPAFLDSGTLRIAGRIVQLEGVMGIGAAYVRDVESYIGDREIACRPTMAEHYRCQVDGYDLSEIVLLNGRGRAAPDAPPDLVDAERQARSDGRGVWATPVLIRGR
jgi:penicillin-binding protein 1A